MKATDFRRSLGCTSLLAINQYFLSELHTTFLPVTRSASNHTPLVLAHRPRWLQIAEVEICAETIATIAGPPMRGHIGAGEVVWGSAGRRRRSNNASIRRPSDQAWIAILTSICSTSDRAAASGPEPMRSTELKNYVCQAAHSVSDVRLISTGRCSPEPSRE
jgi:hypothetical protein